MSVKTFKTNTVNDTELVYSLLKEKYPERQIDIEFNDNTKEYTLQLTNKKFTNDPEIPVDLQIKVIYGDSVIGDTPLLLLDPVTNLVCIKSIQMIFDEPNKINYPGFKIYDHELRLDKQYSSTLYKVWTDNGWSNIKKVIRHKTNKKTYRVLTNTGCVDVTEDHSLCTPDLKSIKPANVNIGTSLLHSFPTEFNYSNSDISDVCLSEDEAKCFGLFLANGSCGNNKNVLDNTWSLSSNNLHLLRTMQNLFESVEDTQFMISTPVNYHMEFKLAPTSNIKKLSDKYRKLFYECKYKNVPQCIINASANIKKSFLEGFCSESFVGSLSKESIYLVKGKTTAMGIYYIIKSLGQNINISLSSEPGQQDLYIFTHTNSNSKSNSDTITKIIGKRYSSMNEYVYDLETECGRFHAGVGEMIVFNTDSVFLALKYNRNDYTQNRKDTFKLATLCGDNLTHEIFKRPPIEMEFEKVFHPFILLSKKRYIGRKYDNMKDPFEMTKLVTSGIALTRRDYCKMVKKCYKEIIEVIMEMKENDINVISKGIEIFKNYINNILNYNIPFDDLIVSALLAKSYKTRPVHLILAEKLKARNEEVQIGSRIPYIYIESDDKTKMKSELGEDPDYAKKHNLKFNRLCYLEQLAKPILSFLCIVLKDNEERCDELIDYVNSIIINLGGKKLKNSDFKIFTDE